MSFIARLFDIKNLPIGVKLLRSFGTVLVLLIVISAISVVGFRTFRGIAEDNALMGRVQANLLIAQGLVKDFVRTRDMGLVARFDERFDQLEALAGQAVAAIDEPERAQRVAVISSDLADYRRGFSQVVQYTAERERLMADMGERGDRMLYAMHEVMRIAFETNEPVWSYYAGMAQEGLLLGRVYTDRFLDANRQQDYDKAMGELSEKLDSIFGMLQQNLQSAEGQAYVTELIDSKIDYLADLQGVYEVIMAQNVVVADTLNVLGPKVADDAEWVKLDVMAQQDSLGNLIGILSVVMSLLGIALALFITRVMTRAIKGPVDELVTLAQAMVRGDLSHKTQIDQQDELGTLARAFTAMQDKLAGLLQTTNDLIEAVSHGKLDQRADDSNYEGAYRHLVDGVNELCDSFVKPIHVTAEYVDRIARGDIPPRITEEYQGDFNEIKSSLNQAIDVMNSLLAETDHLIVATRNGQLDRRGRPEQFSGDWGKLVRGMNELVEAFVRPINVTADYVDRIARGDIPPPITEEYKGDFNAIKNNLNKAVAVMSGLSAEIGKLIKAAEQGKLDVRAESKGLEGTWDDMIRGLNNLVTAFVQPLQVSADYVDRIARGDLPQPIAAQYHGDFNAMKNNLNQLIANLQAFSSALAGIIEAVRRGQLATRADSGALAGTWHQMVDGVNQVLTAFTEPLNEGGEVLGVMATGDLRPRMQGQYQGDFLAFRNNINRLGDSLSSLIEQVNETVVTTADSARSISGTAEDLSVSSREQAMQSEQISAAVAEMAKTITENAMNATRTAEVATNSGRIANDGGEILQQTIVKMRDISHVVSDSAQTIGKLGQSSKEVGEIINVIGDIAYQTNLLALNAAIEAARAGEQGRGFAVVADEVRSLAERTGNATKEIETMIQRIQKQTDEAVTAMDRGTSEVQAGIELADNAGSSLKEILESIQTVLDRVNQIATASEQQSATSEQISASVRSISDVSAESTTRVEGVTRTAEDLAKLTDRLQSLMGQFQVPRA